MGKKVDQGVEKLFGSKTRVKLLSLFLTNAKKSFYVREVTRLVDEQINSVRRELANLHNLGVLKSDTYDNKLFYAINKRYPHYDALKSIFTANTDSGVPAKVEGDSKWELAIKPVEELMDVLLVADHMADSNNVVDMLIVGRDLDGRLSRWAKSVEKKHEQPLSYTVLSPEEFYYRFSVKDQFVRDILNSGMQVVVDEKNILKGDK
ncbi:transcriptional regulator [Candidatus Saccharibacteria bacterium]|nr:transcriptional regulator [Candidatus Saccharibacteria bacterium]